MRTLRRIVFVLLAVMTVAFAQNPANPNLMPLPANVQYGNGRLTIDSTFSISLTGYTEPRLQRAVSRADATLARATGMPINAFPTGSNDKPTLIVHTDHASKDVQEVGEDESYELVINPDGSKLNAPTPLGVLRGLQTFIQLVELTPAGFSAPAVTIHDQPRFAWRGLMLDVSRHWMPIDVVKRNLDGMEAVKLNVFHWHLSDNQGFRVESKKFPKLQELGSDGHYYTQEEVKDVIAYARDRGIRVIPEFDMPGHGTAMLVGYPEIGSSPGPYTIERQFGVFDPAMDPTNEETYKFLDGFIGEMTALFPDQYFHIGGDEVNGKAWDANNKIQQWMKSHNIKNNEELQSHFVKRVQEIVAKHHKTMVGWDEILSPDLPKSIVIQSWRGPDSLAQAAKLGYHGLLSFGYYLDLYQSAEFHYLNEPFSGKAADLNDAEKKMILGGEACMWSELVTPQTVDSRIWPRMAAIAERFWSAQNTRDIPSMYARLEAESQRLEWTGLQHRSYYHPMLERIAGNENTDAVKVLADVVQAPSGYAREGLHKQLVGHEYTSLESYNRLVDASHPESIAAVRFNTLAAKAAAKNASPEEIAELRESLAKWRDNDAKLRQQIQSSYLLKEAAPLSENLSLLGTMGLQALEYLENGTKPPTTWTVRWSAARENADRPVAELLLAISPGVEQLVRAAAQ